MSINNLNKITLNKYLAPSKPDEIANILVAESQIEDFKPFIKNYLEQRRSK